METPEALKRSIGTAEELHSVVRTMKTLSSTSIRQYDSAVSAMGHYVRTVELGFRVLLREQAIPIEAPRVEPGWPLGLVVFGTDRGFCGAFNRDIAAFTLDWLHERERDAERRVACLGTHLAPELERRGEVPTTVARMPSSVEGIVDSVQTLLLELDEWQAQGVERIVMFHQRPAEEHTHEPHVTRVIPLDREWLRSLAQRPWPTRKIPASYLEPRALLTALTREYVFAVLYRAHAESLAAEHAARLDAMRSAEQTIEDRLDELGQRYHQVRQAAITEELLDVTSGFEALAGAED